MVCGLYAFILFAIIGSVYFQVVVLSSQTSDNLVSAL